jgi:hypothetical protein
MAIVHLIVFDVNFTVFDVNFVGAPVRAAKQKVKADNEANPWIFALFAGIPAAVEQEPVVVLGPSNGPVS